MKTRFLLLLTVFLFSLLFIYCAKKESAGGQPDIIIIFSDKPDHSCG